MKKNAFIVKFIKLTVIAFVIFYAGTSIAVYLYQERLIFFPTRTATIPPGGMNIKEISFNTGDGETLCGWWMDCGGKRTVLFMHGNAGCLTDFAYQMEVCRKLGLNTLMFDYRGYGESTGSIRSEKDLYADGEAAWRFLTADKGIPDKDIIIWGQSLGGGVASEIAQNKNVDAVILDSTFNSMEEMAAREFPYLPTTLLLKYSFRTDRKLSNIHAPLLIIHSVDDDIVPYKQGLELYDEASTPKEFLKVTGPHISAYFDCEGQYLGGINGFLKQVDEINQK